MHDLLSSPASPPYSSTRSSAPSFREERYAGRKEGAYPSLFLPCPLLSSLSSFPAKGRKADSKDPQGRKLRAPRYALRRQARTLII